VTNVSVAPASVDAAVIGTPVQLTATATLAATTGTATGCTAPPTRDFSLLTTWSSTNKAVAEVDALGLVEPTGAGNANIHWVYPGSTPATTFSGDVPVTVTP